MSNNRVPAGDPYRDYRFLERVSNRDEPLWSALVVSKGSRRPSTGFYVLARRLRHEYAAFDDHQAWEAEQRRCYDAARAS
ncbi:hypothetical protein [Amycolatopsis tolypomycina]|uniref:hypothetical protein n=1 Tax=Amycolatopsis tolypomycina TaxID=208445 RepID=UPI0033B64B67